MKTLKASIFDPDFEPTKENIRQPWKNVLSEFWVDSFQIDSKYGIDYIKHLIDPIIENHKFNKFHPERYKVGQNFINKRTPFMRMPSDDVFYVYGFNDSGKAYEIKLQYHDTMRASKSNIAIFDIIGRYNTLQYLMNSLAENDIRGIYSEISSDEFNKIYNFVKSL